MKLQYGHDNPRLSRQHKPIDSKFQPMSIRQRAAKGLVWSVVQKWGRDIISFGTFALLSRLLAPEAFGLLALAVVFVAFVEILMDQGLVAAIVQRATLEPEHLDSAFWASISLSVVLTAGGITGSTWMAVLFREPQLAPILSWLSLGFVVNAMSSTQISILQRNLAFKSLAARSLAATTMGGIVGIAMALSGYGVWSLVGQNLANGVVGALVLWRASEWRPGLNISVKHYTELFKFGIPVVGNNLLKVLVRRSDDLLIGYFLGSTALGYYTIGYRLLLVIMRLVTGITNAVAFPTFSRLQHDSDRLRRAFYEVTQYTSVLAFPVFAGLGILAPELVPALFGPKWEYSIPVMQILSLIGILQSVVFFNGSVMRASGKPAWEFGIMLLNTVCTVIGFLIAVRWGIVSVAISFVVVGYLLAPVSYVVVRRLIGIELGTYLGQFTAPLFASSVMVLLILGLKNVIPWLEVNVYVELAMYVAAGAVTYLLLILLTARNLSRQILDLVALVMPRSTLKKTI